jgi:hypothetical protein
MAVCDLTVRALVLWRRRGALQATAGTIAPRPRLA